MSRKNRRILALVLAVLLALGAGCGFYLADYSRADEEALALIQQPRNGVRIIGDASSLRFIPDSPRAGLIFYPGGKVQCEAYAPLMQLCAENGILCVLTRMPANLAVLKPNAAEGIAAQFPDITRWYIGGHSLGGAMAASFAASHASELEGLILLAAYSTADLRASGLRVLSVYGSEDGVLNMDKYENSRKNLPEDLTELVIPGGCHAGFGNYGAQSGDGAPSISGAEQQALTLQAILALIGQ